MYEWIGSHKWMRRATLENESCHSCACVMSHVWTSCHSGVWHDAFTGVTWHICTQDLKWGMSHVIIHTCQNYRSLLQNIVSFIGLFCTRDLKKGMSHVIMHTCQNYICFVEYSLFYRALLQNKSHSCERVMAHVWISHATCHTCGWDVSRMWMRRQMCECVVLCVRMSQGTHVYASFLVCECVNAHMWMSHVIDVNESCHRCEWVMT